MYNHRSQGKGTTLAICATGKSLRLSVNISLYKFEITDTYVLANTSAISHAVNSTWVGVLAFLFYKKGKKGLWKDIPI